MSVEDEVQRLLQTQLNATPNRMRQRIQQDEDARRKPQLDRQQLTPFRQLPPPPLESRIAVQQPAPIPPKEAPPVAGPAGGGVSGTLVPDIVVFDTGDSTLYYYAFYSDGSKTAV